MKINKIFQCAWVSLQDKDLLVMCTTLGVFVYEWDGSLLLNSYTLPSPGPQDYASFTRGVAVVSASIICIGKF